jgi:hypothetical protein
MHLAKWISLSLFSALVLVIVYTLDSSLVSGSASGLRWSPTTEMLPVICKRSHKYSPVYVSV